MTAAARWEQAGRPEDPEAAFELGMRFEFQRVLRVLDRELADERNERDRSYVLDALEKFASRVRTAICEDTSEPASPRARPRNVFAIPEGTTARECRSCRARVFWIKTDAGRNMPVDPDGTSHFATCPDAAKHRRPR